MDPKLLVEERINEGQRLLVELVRAGLDVAIAFWVCTRPEGLWHLYLSSAALAADKIGDASRTVYAWLSRHPDPIITLSDIKFIGADHPWAKAVLEIQRRHPNKTPQRLARPALVSMGIEQVYIYPPAHIGSEADTFSEVRGLFKITHRSGLHIFLYGDPRQQGFEGEIQENVRLALPEEGWHDWPQGAPRPDICLGVSLKDQKHYKVFRTTEDCRRAGFQPLGPNYAIFADWAQFQKMTAA